MFLILIFSIYLMISSAEWLLIWSGMEINMLSFLSLCKNLFQGGEFEFKYFMIQFIGSMMFLSSSLFNSSLLMFMSLCLKLLLVPFVFWILPCLNWMSKSTFMYFLIMQKIGPFFIMISFMKISKLMFLFLLLNIIYSIFFIFYKNSMKLIMTFSSIIQLSFMIMLINVSMSMVYMFFFIYIFSSLLTLISCLFNLISFKKSFILFMISGFPPFYLFFIKLWFLMFMISLLMKILSLFFVMTSSIMTYIYMKMIMKNFFFNYTLKVNWFVKQSSFWIFYLVLGLLLI